MTSNDALDQGNYCASNFAGAAVYPMQTEEHLKEKLMPLIALTLLTLLLLALPGWSTDLNLLSFSAVKTPMKSSTNCT